MKEELEMAIYVAKEAAKVACNMYDKFSKLSRTKIDKTPVTLADLGAQILICREIKTHFPDDGIYAEETADSLNSYKNTMEVGHLLEYMRQTTSNPYMKYEDLLESIEIVQRSKSKRWWVVDPIDGTRGFINGGQYAICISLLDENRSPILCVIACPNYNNGVIVWAIRNEGAWLESLWNSNSKRELLSVADPVDDISKIKICQSVHQEKCVEEKHKDICKALNVDISKSVKVDSQCKYLMIADGSCHVYIRNASENYKEKIWDHASGWLLVKEAGGYVTDLHGNDLDFSTGPILSKNHGILATNSLKIHQQFINESLKQGDPIMKY